MLNSYLLKPLTVIYNAVTSIHRNLYNTKILQKTGLKARVIGVGNLSFGGSGKTLLCQAIAEKLSSQGRRVGIVCRSTGGEDGPHFLGNGNADPYIVGDEAAMIAEIQNLFRNL
jgi:tetraacyldisaccharide 4'-kinase